MPEEHRGRIANNHKIYVEHMKKMQEEYLKQQEALSQKIQKEANKTTLTMSPEAATIKL